MKIFLTLMAFLVITLLSLNSYAMSEHTSNHMMQHVSTNMDMNKCHHQQSGMHCQHCTDQHNCNTAHSGCATSSVDLSSQNMIVFNQSVQLVRVAVLAESAIHRDSPPLIRPPIVL